MSRTAVIVTAAALAAGLLRAEDWPQWRGPARDGVAVSVPAAWPEALSRRWTLEIGAGHASPVVAGGVVYAFSREGESEVVRAIDLDTGAERWRSAYDAAYQMNPAATFHGEGPKATPLVADGRLFTAGISGFVSAHDAETGARLWQLAPRASRSTDTPPRRYSRRASSSSTPAGTTTAPFARSIRPRGARCGATPVTGRATPRP